MFISKELESLQTENVLNRLLELMNTKWLDWKTEDVLVMCISPDYSGAIGLRVLHRLSKGREFPNYAVADVPFPDSNVDVLVECKKEFHLLLDKWKQKANKVILVEAGILTGGNYTWMTKMIRHFGFKDVITVALIEKEQSIFKCDVVGMYSKDMPTFWWEEDNKHWDGVD